MARNKGQRGFEIPLASASYTLTPDFIRSEGM